LDNNHITGTIPPEIGLLTELASVSITNATLTGTIPTEVGNLVGLRRLWLYSNELTGQIPAQLNKLEQLEVLEIHHNDLGGAMPQGICSTIEASLYQYKSLTSDCGGEVSDVQCSDSCCTDCFE
jgi:Leucine-rich repeat (LRR) protein